MEFEVVAAVQCGVGEAIYLICKWYGRCCRRRACPLLRNSVGGMSLQCRCCSSTYTYPNSDAFLACHDCGATEGCITYFLDTYAQAVLQIVACPASVELCKFLTHVNARDPLFVEVFQDVYFPRKRAPQLYDARWNSSLSLDCADLAALILAVTLYDPAEPLAWKNSKRMRVHLTAKSSLFTKEAWKQVETAAAGWSSSDEDD